MHEMFFYTMESNTISIDNEIVNRLGKVRNIKCYLQSGRGIWITTGIFSAECEYEMEISRNETETEFKLSNTMLEKEGIFEGDVVSVQYRDFAFSDPAIIIKRAR